MSTFGRLQASENGARIPPGRAVAVVQARMSSTRLPGKVLKPLCGEPLLWRIVERLRAAAQIDGIIIATSTDACDEPIVRFARERDIAVFAGHRVDVLDRCYQAARRFGADPLVRVTADCPFVEPALVDRAIEVFLQSAAGGGRGGAGGRLDYVYVNSVSSYPDGLDTEVIAHRALARAWREAAAPYEREHATSYITRHPELFAILGLDYTRDVSHVRLTVDTADDLALAEVIYRRLYRPERLFTLQDVLTLLERQPALLELNGQVFGNEAYYARREARRRQIAAERRQIV